MRWVWTDESKPDQRSRGVSSNRRGRVGSRRTGFEWLLIRVPEFMLQGNAFSRLCTLHLAAGWVVVGMLIRMIATVVSAWHRVREHERTRYYAPHQGQPRNNCYYVSHAFHVTPSLSVRQRNFAARACRADYS